MQKYNQDYFKVGGSNIEDRDDTRLNRLSKKALQAKRVGEPPAKKPRKAAVKKAQERKAGKRPAVAGAAATKPRARGTHDGDPVAHVEAKPAPAPRPPQNRPTANTQSRTRPRAVPAERFPDALPGGFRFRNVARQLVAAPFTVARLIKQLRKK